MGVGGGWVTDGMYICSWVRKSGWVGGRAGTVSNGHQFSLTPDPWQQARGRQRGSKKMAELRFGVWGSCGGVLGWGEAVRGVSGVGGRVTDGRLVMVVW